jgi:hypothetical protein
MKRLMLMRAALLAAALLMISALSPSAHAASIGNFYKAQYAGGGIARQLSTTTASGGAFCSPPGDVFTGAGTYQGTYDCNGITVTYSGTVTVNQTGTVYTGTFSGTANGQNYSFSSLVNTNSNSGSFTATTPVGTLNGSLSGSNLHLTGTLGGITFDCNINVDTGAFSGACGGSGSTANNKVAAAGRTQQIVQQNILTTQLQTTNEVADQKEQEQQQEKSSATRMPRMRVYLADANVEINSLGGAHTTTGGVTIGATQEANNWTLGAMIPLDYLSQPGGDAARLGVVGFAQYNYHPSDNRAWSFKPTVFASYIYTAGFHSAASFGTYGVGTGFSATYDDGGKFIPALLAFISYNKDDTGVADNYQTLVAVGPKIGFRPSDNWVLEVGAVYNKDISSYIPSGTKDYFFDVSAGASYRVSRTFKLDINYRKTLGIQNFSSDLISIGGRFSF